MEQQDTYLVPAIKTSAGLAFIGPDSTILKMIEAINMHKIWTVVLSIERIAKIGIRSNRTTNAVTRKCVIVISTDPVNMKTPWVLTFGDLESCYTSVSGASLG